MFGSLIGSPLVKGTSKMGKKPKKLRRDQSLKLETMFNQISSKSPHSLSLSFSVEGNATTYIEIP